MNFEKVLTCRKYLFVSFNQEKVPFSLVWEEGENYTSLNCVKTINNFVL